MYKDHVPYCELLGLKTLLEMKQKGLGHVVGWIKTDDMLVRVDKVLRLYKTVTVKHRSYIMPIPENQKTMDIDLTWLHKFRHVGNKYHEGLKRYNDKVLYNIDNLYFTGYQLNYIRKFMKITSFHYEIEGDLLAIYDNIGVRIVIKGVVKNDQNTRISG